MAEAILFGVAQKMIVSLGSQIFQEIGSLWGVKDELQKIKSAVSRIQAVLQDAAEQQNHNHQVRDWLEKLKDVVYDADDLLGEFFTEALRRRAMSGNKIKKEVRTFFSSSNQLAFRIEMSGKIKAMRKKLDAIAKENRDFNLKVSPPENYSLNMQREETHSFVPNEEVIGREHDKEKIIKLLLEPNNEENLSVIPIVGIGGLGKTTLAQFVYNDENVDKHFELKMWVCVSDAFELKIIVEKIIASAACKKPEDLHMDELQKLLREKIDKKKYLLVLDDVWNESRNKWDNLKRLLKGGAKGSKIIITTRVQLVAEITSPVSIHTLKGLSEDESWSLFEQIAFTKGEETNNSRLKEIGKEILVRCQGVPLAIKSIGSVLCLDKTEPKWSRVKDNVLTNILQPGDDIFPILKLSYDNLPSHLKSCFAYCSVFPKDCEIEKEMVVQLWIAQGFIQLSNTKQQLEEVANEYFKDLLWRSFFEEVGGEFGNLKYKMHDLIHDLAESVAMVDCKQVDRDSKNVDEKIRHVSCEFFTGSSFNETLSLLVKAKKIRTFLLTSNYFNELDEPMLNTINLNFRSLRALDIGQSEITMVPNSIGNLIHLKYLDLSRSYDMVTLPKAITRLWNLQTLKVFSCQSLKELPKDIKELVNLRHLDDNDCDALSNMPRGIGQLTCLQTLPLFVVSKDSSSISKHVGGLGELNQLNNIRGTLEITHLERLEDANSECKAANISGKQHLEELKLRWDQEGNINNDDEKSLDGLQPHQNLKYLSVQGYGGVRFSSWLSLLANLVEIEINGERCQHLPRLSQLPSLQSLDLFEMMDLEYMSDGDISEEVPASSTVSSTPFFPSLKSLSIVQCPKLKGWWRSASMQDHHHHSLPSFPCLSYLHIYECPNLTSMPLFPYLEENLYLENVSFMPLQETMAMASLVPPSSPLSKLKIMTVSFREDEVPLLDDWPSNLMSLKKLMIWCSPGLTSLPEAVRYLTSLRSLAFKDLPKLESLPASLQHLTNLQDLYIIDCPSLTILPEWISKLTSLETLGIDRCPNLASLPDELQCLRSLQRLKIVDCPLLAKRCEKGTGEDWSKIAHIPNINHTWEYISFSTHFRAKLKN
ncbi:disease resistance protein RGA2-like [Castanea sativa]|uniref:disease resistance protein RGA2-like n=1 Tax=Castanea sativa TaxID=21020 RepID=UPI003F650432